MLRRYQPSARRIPPAAATAMSLASMGIVIFSAVSLMRNAMPKNRMTTPTRVIQFVFARSVSKAVGSLGFGGVENGSCVARSGAGCFELVFVNGL